MIMVHGPSPVGCRIERLFALNLLTTKCSEYVFNLTLLAIIYASSSHPRSPWFLSLTTIHINPQSHICIIYNIRIFSLFLSHGFSFFLDFFSYAYAYQRHRQPSSNHRSPITKKHPLIGPKRLYYKAAFCIQTNHLCTSRFVYSRFTFSTHMRFILC